MCDVESNFKFELEINPEIQKINCNYLNKYLKIGFIESEDFIHKVCQNERAFQNLERSLLIIHYFTQEIMMDMNTKIKGAFVSISDIVNLQRICKPQDLKTFFMIMEIWGSN